jgi:hypothetical protein
VADFAGQVLLDNDMVDVVVDLRKDTVSLVAGDVEIGTWATEDCKIRPLGDGRWTIHAENDSLAFEPEDPGGFERNLNGTATPVVTKHPGRHLKGNTLHQSPPPHLITLLGFYLLAAVTGALGIWAIISLII